MKKQLRLLFVLVAANFFIFSSCHKSDSTPPPAPKTKTQLITQGTWKFKSATVGGSPYTFPSCQTDNILSFGTAGSGTGTVDEGVTKCNAGDPQINNFTWVFQNNETEILLSTPLFTNGSNTVTVISLTETELVLSMPVSTPGPVLIVQVTFQH